MMMMMTMMMMMMQQHWRYCCRSISVQHLVAANTRCYYDFYNTGAAMVNGIRTTATTATTTTTTTTMKSSSLPRRHSSSCHRYRASSTFLDCRHRRSFSSTTVIASTDEPKHQQPQPQPQQQQRLQQIRLLRQLWRESMQNDKKYLILYDHGQLQAAKRLERLQIALQGYDNQPIRRHAMEMFQWKQQQQQQQQQQQNHKEQGKLVNDNDENNDSSKETASSSSSSSLPANDATKRRETNTRNATTTKLSKSRHEGTGPPLTMDDDNDDCANSTAGSGSPTETTTTAVASPPPPPQQQQQQLLLPRVPRGLYLYGHVGTGKSMLMDTFFDLVQVAPGSSKSSSTRRKQKMHFHAFMADIHQRMHALRNNKDNRERDGDGDDDDDDYDDDDWPILHRVGFQLANDVSLLCLDEFQISDVADAMILSQLLHVLFVSGVVLVTTSNRPPHDLYPDDVSGEYFSTFVQNLMQRYCILHEMESTIDYRQQCSSTMMDVSSSTTSSSSAATPFWISSRSIQWTLSDNIDQHDEIDDGTVYSRDCIRTTVDDILAQQLVGRCHDDAGHGGGDIVYAPFDLPLGHGRSLKIPQVAHVEIINNNIGAVSSSSSSSSRLRPPRGTVHVARMTFHQLCHDDSLLGACDYRALARHFDVVVVEEIPILNVSTVAASQDYNQAKRFVILIDELYEAKSTLMCSSLQAMHPNEIFIRGRDGSHEDMHGDADEPSKSNDKSNAAAVGGAAIDGVVSHGHTLVVNAGIRELQLASKRASSRLTEMTSQRWWRQRIIEKKESSSSKAQTPK